jgi:glyoxylase-like metal-dependent hydrolase (beta-lactamase superfamily II)
MQITNGVHLIPGTIANVYLIIEPTGLVLVDTGLPSSGRKIHDYLESLGYRLEDIKHILITHADDDHYGALAELVRLSSARTYASQPEAEAMQKGQSSRSLKLSWVMRLPYQLLRLMVRARPVKIDQILQNGQTLPFLGGLRVISSPGHTPGHLSYYCPTQGILFAGDAMRSDGDKLTPSRGFNTWDENLALESVARQATLNARIVCVGHGPVIYEAQNRFPEIKVQ